MRTTTSISCLHRRRPHDSPLQVGTLSDTLEARMVGNFCNTWPWPVARTATPLVRVVSYVHIVLNWGAWSFSAPPFVQVFANQSSMASYIHAIVYVVFDSVPAGEDAWPFSLHHKHFPVTQCGLQWRQGSNSWPISCSTRCLHQNAWFFLGTTLSPTRQPIGVDSWAKRCVELLSTATRAHTSALF